MRILKNLWHSQILLLFWMLIPLHLTDLEKCNNVPMVFEKKLKMQMLLNRRSDLLKRRKHLKSLKKKQKQRKRKKSVRNRKKKRKRKLNKKQRNQARESKLSLLKKQHLQVLKRKRRKRRRRRLMLQSFLLFPDQSMIDLKTCLFISMTNTVLGFWQQQISNLKLIFLRRQIEQLMCTQTFLLKNNILANQIMKKTIGVEDQLNNSKIFHFHRMKKLKISKTSNVSLVQYSLKIKWKRSLIRTLRS